MALGFLYGSGGGGQPKPEITALIPIMTSNNTPKGLCIGSTVYSTYALYKGFDGSLSTKTVFQDVATPYIGYRFDRPVCVTAFSFRANTDAPYLPPTEMQFQTSDDGTNWADVGEPITNIDADADVHRFNVEILAPHLYYRWVCKARQYLANSYVQFSQLQIYGYYPEVKPLTIYDSGSWGVGCESKGDYTYTESGWSAADMIINPDNIAVNTSAGSNKDCIVGTTNKVDLTNYTMMKCICKGMNSMGAGRMRICSGKNVYSQSLGNYYMNAGTSPTEFAWDISTYNGEYYLVIEAESVRNAYYYKWWLE